MPDPAVPEEFMRLFDDIHSMAHSLQEIARILHRLVVQPQPAVTFDIHQIGESMAITGVKAGGTGTFSATPVQSDGVTPGALQPGNIPQWSSTDSLVSISQSSDGSVANVSVGATDTNTSFPLTVTGVNSAGTSISTTVNVPIIAVTVPPATGFSINQTA